MNKTTVYYYISPNGNNPVKGFIASLEVRQQVKVRRILILAQTYGLESIRPYVKKLSGSPLWEIRILGKDNIRVLYVAISGNAIVALHGFYKKTQKTPPKEIETALTRLKFWKSH